MKIKIKEEEVLPSSIDQIALQEILNKMNLSDDILNFNWLKLIKNVNPFLDQIEILLKATASKADVRNFEILEEFVNKNIQNVYSLLK